MSDQVMHYDLANMVTWQNFPQCLVTMAFQTDVLNGSSTFRRIHNQGLHRLEKYLILEGFLEKSLKIKYSMKSTGKSLKCLEKTLNSSFLL